jgi:hypothetical protein
MKFISLIIHTVFIASFTIGIWSAAGKHQKLVIILISSLLLFVLFFFTESELTEVEKTCFVDVFLLHYQKQIVVMRINKFVLPYRLMPLNRSAAMKAFLNDAQKYEEFSKCIEERTKPGAIDKKKTLKEVYEQLDRYEDFNLSEDLHGKFRRLISLNI